MRTRTMTHEPFKFTILTPVKFLVWGLAMGAVAVAYGAKTGYRWYQFWRL